MSGVTRWFMGLPIVGRVGVALAATVAGLWALVLLTTATAVVVAAWTDDSPGVSPAPAAGQRPATPSPTGPAPSSTSSVPTASPSPAVRTELETVVEPVPHGEVTREDPTLDRGAHEVAAEGRDGERTLTYEVTYVAGQETGRTLVEDVVTRDPVDEVVVVGTRQPTPPAPAPEPEPAPAPEPADDCDPNYTGGCVPVASDVDCAGGSGNGPAYVAGPVTVVGEDVYDLDGDGDGTACE